MDQSLLGRGYRIAPVLCSSLLGALLMTLTISGHIALAFADSSPANNCPGIEQFLATISPGQSSQDILCKVNSGNGFALGKGTESYAGRTLRFAFWAFEKMNRVAGYAALDNVALPPHYTGGQDHINGRVTCLAIAGKTANLVFVVQHTSNSSDFPIGEQILYAITENGNLSGNHSYVGYLPEPSFRQYIQQICSGTPAFTGAGVVTRGFVFVHDPLTAMPGDFASDVCAGAIDRSARC